MAETVKIEVTREWVQLAPSQCEVQSISDRDAYDKVFFDLVIGGTKPASTTDTFMRIQLSEHANFHRTAPVWVRLNKINDNNPQSVVVIR